MHLKEVTVPVRLSMKQIGQANIFCARTRPKVIGGERAHYVEELKWKRGNAVRSLFSVIRWL